VVDEEKGPGTKVAVLGLLIGKLKSKKIQKFQYDNKVGKPPQKICADQGQNEGVEQKDV